MWDVTDENKELLMAWISEYGQSETKTFVENHLKVRILNPIALSTFVDLQLHFRSLVVK